MYNKKYLDYVIDAEDRESIPNMKFEHTLSMTYFHTFLEPYYNNSNKSKKRRK